MNDETNISNTPQQGGNTTFLFNQTVGKTTYNVAVHFSNTSGETLEDKILKLVQNEARYCSHPILDLL